MKNAAVRSGYWDVGIALLLVACIALWFSGGFGALARSLGGLFAKPEQATANIFFYCVDGGSFQAIFYPNNVHLHLGDGQDAIVPEVSSTTYAASDGSLSFTYAGAGASVVQKGTTLYSDCTPGQNNYS